MIFNEAYNREKFSEFLRDLLPEDFVEREQDLSHIDSCKVITQAKELGVSSSLGVHVLEMSHGKETDPRVAIATDAFRILATYQIDKALVVFNSNNSENYRFSLLTVSLDINEKNKLVKTYSNARRFSFYLGPGAKARTPEHQLISKGRVKDTSDLIDRFSLEVVNKQFYLELAKHFDALVDQEKKLLSLPSQSDSNARKSFAMRLIGRIMFCWFLKQKHSPTDGPLIPDELLSSKAVQDGYFHNVLEPLFFGILNTPLEGRDIRGKLYDSVPYLNGGLFNPQHDDYYDLDREILVSKHINTLVISDKWFRNFFSLLETYNFTIDENTVFDQELSVDPEMLGRIFENLLAEINPETGSSERKRTGSYYTPRQIVEYMVDRSLIEHLKTKTGIDEEKLEALVSYDLSDDSKNPLELSERKSVIDAIDSLRLLDPACGSGAFPIGALQKIVWILQRVDADCELWLEKKLAKVPELYKQKIRKDATTNPFDYTRKLDVIKNSIFGVDIQPIAVEIARLRCFLTLVVESEVNDSKPNRGVEPLPNLDFKFVCANTLIPAPDEGGGGDRLFTDDFEEKLSAAVDRYFSSFGASKSSAGNDIHRLIDSKVDEQLKRVQNLISHSDERYQAALAKTNKKSIDTQTRVLNLWASYKNLFENKSVGFFDPKYFFPGVKNGFDIVIGNPPYLRTQGLKQSNPETFLRYKDLYKSATGSFDLYILFVERGFSLTSESGIVNYIMPDKWINSSFGKGLREVVVENQSLSKLVSFKENQIFDASTYSSLIWFTKQNNKTIKYLELGPENNLQNINDSSFSRIPYSNLEVGGFEFKDGHIATILSKFKKTTYPLGKVFSGIIQGVATGMDAVFFVEVISEHDGIAIVRSSKDHREHEIESALIKPLLKGDSIHRYEPLSSTKGVIFPYTNRKLITPISLQNSYPKTYAYLSLFEEDLRMREGEKFNNDEWYQFSRNQGFLPPEKKIVGPYLSYGSQYSIDENGKYLTNTKCYSYIKNEKVPLSYEYLIAILNSKVTWFFIMQKSSVMRGGYRVYAPKYLETFSIPTPDDTTKKAIESLVSKVTTLKSQSLTADTSALEHQIDHLVYQLYDLTDEEIKIVEYK